LAEPSRQLAQKVNQKEKERTDREEGQTNEEKTEEQKEEARDEYVFSLFYVKTKKKY
jgi:ribosomal protein L12E/L44/L45/RPP1/RPP2